MKFAVRPCLFAAITSLGLAWGCSLNGQGEIPGSSETGAPGDDVGHFDDDGMTGAEPPNQQAAGGAGAGYVPDDPSAGGASAASGGAANGGGAGAAGGAPGGAAAGGADAGPLLNSVPDAGPSAGSDADGGVSHDENLVPPCDAWGCDAGAP